MQLVVGAFSWNLGGIFRRIALSHESIRIRIDFVIVYKSHQVRRFFLGFLRGLVRIVPARYPSLIITVRIRTPQGDFVRTDGEIGGQR
jgi:hypothetical protein